MIISTTVPGHLELKGLGIQSARLEVSDIYWSRLAGLSLAFWNAFAFEAVVFRRDLDVNIQWIWGVDKLVTPKSLSALKMGHAGSGAQTRQRPL